MTAILALMVMSLTALTVIVVLAFFDKDRHRAASALLVARAKDIETYQKQTLAMVAGFANSTIAMSARETDQMKLVLDAAIADRQRLLTALLAMSATPTAARTLGMVDQAQSRVERDMTTREFLEATLRERAPRDTETETSDGEPIVPVGM